MDQNRKDTIIREIKYWKDNQLLPDHYCDFLLALYSEGEIEDDETDDVSDKKVRKDVSVFPVLFLMLNLIVVPSVVSLVYFLNVTISFFITLIVITLIIVIGFYYIGSRIHGMSVEYVLGVLLLNLLLISIVIIEQWIPNVWLSLVIVLGQLLLWLYIGYKRASKLLMAMGVIGILVMLIAVII
ncbi:hypothetical protein SAMN05421734_103262 [Pelagirhabdus alkalitolerans]|uniref:Uncharacterized protein n=1 Tax=Pelagirhabdus alkalitolerans TaxID=1612202 RepID=A0A1G6HWW1_9BACI|nr:hypothetical protein [Pelagirhabdus alkalitolerans]SDB98680.1 hypothetical protein SAMN05421734_103262 [Pelagirhabdus alkalitolerans]